jgi:hypothetical protein
VEAPCLFQTLCGLLLPLILLSLILLLLQQLVIFCCSRCQQLLLLLCALLLDAFCHSRRLHLQQLQALGRQAGRQQLMLQATL